MQKLMVWAFVGALALAVLACGPAQPSATPTPPNTITAPPSPTPGGKITPVPTPPVSVKPIAPEEPPVSMTPIPTPTDPALQKLVDQAKADLAARLGLKPEQIALLELAAVVWPDSSLGCPQPGMAYTQVLQDGLRIRLGVGQSVYQYHTGAGRGPFFCQSPGKPVP